MGTPRRRAVEPRFWSRVQKGPDCWLWTGGRGTFGYGAFCINGVTRTAHRVSWELFHGRPVPRGMVVRHACDTPPCVNPAHLALGTQAENVRDCWERGRRTRLLTPAQDAEACARYAAGARTAAIAEDLGVSMDCVYAGLHRGGVRKHLDDNDVIDIRSLAAFGATTSALATAYDMKPATVRGIVARRSYVDVA